MKFFSLLVFCFCLHVAAVAQMSAAEEKALKKELKKLTPADYKRLLEEKERLATALDSANQEVETLTSTQSELELALELAEKRLATSDSLKTQQERVEENYSANYTPVQPKGVIYKVQIGAFKKLDLTRYFENHKNFSGEITEGGIMKYTIGEFTDYWEADQFKKYLRQMGVKGAWIVAYKNGERVDIRDALEGAI